MQLNSDTYTLSDSGNFGKIALAAGIVGLALSAVGYFVNHEQFYFSYLTAFVYWTTLGLGALFFTLLHHLVNGKWSIVLRRISEALGMTIPFMAGLFIVVIFGIHDIYHWSHEDVIATDQLIQKKVGFLNPGFFITRSVIYFLIWSFLAWALYRVSLKQDEKFEVNQIVTMRKISAPGMIAFAFTISFAGFDWLMSTDPHWFSTIFGVYVFSGSLLCILAFLIVFCLYLNNKGVLKDTITIEHYHDLGRLLFAFTIFWAYIAFSQFFLIWYANIPEETVWYLHRWEGNWKYFSLLLLYGHFVLPFLALMLRAVKRNLTLLKLMAFWVLLMHWVDIYWLVVPALHDHGAKLSWMDFTTMLGVGGMFLWVFWTRFSSKALVPVNDPRLEESINVSH